MLITLGIISVADLARRRKAEGLRTKLWQGF